MTPYQRIVKLLTGKSPTRLLDEHIESEPNSATRAFPSDGIPYRTAARFLDQKPVTEEDLLRTELALEAWLFRRFERQDSTYVSISETLDILPGKSGHLLMTAQRTVEICRMVLCSPSLDKCQVMEFRIGVETQGDFHLGGVNASLYRLLTFDPIKLRKIISVGECAAIQVKNNSTATVPITGVLLGRQFVEDRAAILTQVRSRKGTVSRLLEQDE